MIELQIVNENDEDCVIQIVLPEDDVVLERKMGDAGIRDEEYRIKSVTSCIGFIEELTTADTRIPLLNALARRMNQLPLAELSELAMLCESDAALTFQKVFCFLDLSLVPKKEKEMAIRFPVTIRSIRYEKKRDAGAMLGRTIAAKEANRYLEELNQYMVSLLAPETGLRGLAYYLTDDVLKKNVFAVYPEIEVEEDNLYMRLTIWLGRWMNSEEQNVLKDAMIRILTFGWGRTLHYDGYHGKNECLTLSFSGAGAEIEQFLSPNHMMPEYQPREDICMLHVMPQGMARKYDEEQEELITLPQSIWGMRDVFERLGCGKEAEIYVGFTGSKIKELEDLFWEWTESGSFYGTLDEWNNLSWMISFMDETKRTAFITVLTEKEAALPIKEIVALAEPFSASPVFYESEKGKSICIQCFGQKKHLYTAVSFPNDDLSEETWKCILAQTESVMIDCKVPALALAIYEDLESFSEIQTLSQMLLSLEQNSQLLKYKAMLELFFAPSLSDALSLSERMSLYDFSEGFQSENTIGQKAFEEIKQTVLTKEEKESICFSECGRRMLVKCGAVKTSYGYLIPKRVSEE